MNKEFKTDPYGRGIWDSLKDVPFSTLLGQTLASVHRIDDEQIVFITETARVFVMYHEQSCCENVYIESIVGDLDDLVGSEITFAEEATSYKEWDDEHDKEQMWTFYKLRTQKGYVDIRWDGSSNGYYSISVALVEIEQ